MQACDAGTQQRCGQAEPEEGMALGPVQHHVEHGVAVVNKDIEVGQGAQHGTPGGGLGEGGTPAHDGHADRGAQRQL